MDSAGTSAPGWYPDPAGLGQMRQWDGSVWTDNVQSAVSGQQDLEVGAGPAQYWGPPILVVTTETIPGFRIVAVHGEVFGITVRARNAFANWGASVRTAFGGEVKGITKLLIDSRAEAVDRLRFAALQVGGNAVVTMRFDTGGIATIMNEVVAYGTAVTVQRIDD
ncbi:MAG: heavy metal-binding domain-containing protein [Candidatus Nanopelagicales bacterium]